MSLTNLFILTFPVHIVYVLLHQNEAKFLFVIVTPHFNPQHRSSHFFSVQLQIVYGLHDGLSMVHNFDVVESCEECVKVLKRVVLPTFLLADVELLLLLGPDLFVVLVFIGLYCLEFA